MMPYSLLKIHCHTMATAAGAHDHGQEEDGAEGALALDLGVEQDGHQQGKEDAHRHRQDAEVGWCSR